MKAPAHLLSLAACDAARWTRLMRLTEALAGPAGRRPLLRGKRIGMVFFNASLRTRTALEVAAFDLGGHAVNLQVGAGLWQMEMRDGVVMDGAAAEHAREGVAVLSRMVDALGVRSFAGLQDEDADAQDTVLRAFAAHATVPVLSLESAMGHPHQGLADAWTVRRFVPKPRARIALTWAPHIKPLPRAVAHAALCAFAHEGHEVVVTHPPGYGLHPDVVLRAEGLAAAAGGTLSFEADQAAACAGADVIYAKSWGAASHYGDADTAAASLAAHVDWRVTRDTFAAAPEARLMHCLPVRRGVVVDAEVLDSERSLVVDQAEARLHVQRATLCDVLGGEVPGVDGPIREVAS